MKDFSLRWIIPIVCFFHFALLSFLSFSDSRKVITPLNKKVVVRTVQLKPAIPVKEIEKTPAKTEIAVADPVLMTEPQKEKKKESPPLAARTIPQKQPLVKTVSPKKEIKKNSISKPVKKPINQTKNPPVETLKEKKPIAEDNKQKELLALAKERVSKIKSNSDNISPSSLTLKEISSPSEIKHFQSDHAFNDMGASLSVKEVAYRDELSHRLKLHLKLPEYGDVKIKLTLDRQGKVILVEIQDQQSVKNASYIKNHLPKIQLPSFGANFGNENTHTFEITLSNE